jgi:hypothetical protein
MKRAGLVVGMRWICGRREGRRPAESGAWIRGRRCRGRMPGSGSECVRPVLSEASSVGCDGGASVASLRVPDCVTGFGKGTRVPVNRNAVFAFRIGEAGAPVNRNAVFAFRIGEAGAATGIVGKGTDGVAGGRFPAFRTSLPNREGIASGRKTGTNSASPPDSSKRRTGAGSYRDFGRSGTLCRTTFADVLAAWKRAQGMQGGRSGGRCPGDGWRSVTSHDRSPSACPDRLNAAKHPKPQSLTLYSGPSSARPMAGREPPPEALAVPRYKVRT